MKNAFLLITVPLFMPGPAVAAPESNGYSNIWNRNAFSLKAPVAVASSAASPMIPVRVKLTGVAAMQSNKWAVLQIQEAGKPSVSVLLPEGGREASVEVLEINAPSGEVMIRIAGAPGGIL